MTNSSLNVAIIGAGISGLTLALTLNQQSIKCAIYETREAPLNIGWHLLIVPNGLKVLAKLGVYDALQKKGFNFDNIYFQDAESKRIIETVEYGNLEKYGFHSMRISRFSLLEELLVAVKEKSIPIHFNKSFDHVVSETKDDVTWQFKDGSVETASLLIGADGIHSSVRSHLNPGLKPIFCSMAGIIGTIPTTQLDLPKGDLVNLNAASNINPMPLGIMVHRLGAFFMMPQLHNGEEIGILVQRRMTEPIRRSDVDADYIRSLFRENSERFPTIVQNAVRDIPDDGLNIWPFYQIPRLEHWTSAKTLGGFGRVIIVGDSAHAVAPVSGQGVNQALEDVYLIALVLGRLHTSGHSPRNEEFEQALFQWQNFRQKRVDHVMELNKQMDLRRAPKALDDNDDSKEELLDLGVMFSWLFNVDYDNAADDCMKGLIFST